MQQIKDIFISYKNDNAGNNFANRLVEDLEEGGYSVYFNSHEQRGGKFPERLRENIMRCKDFVLIVSQGCLDQLLRHDTVDWIREEILTAYQCQKHIIPIVLDNVMMPSNESDWPEDLSFIAGIDYIYFTEQYKNSPFSDFIGFLHSRKERDDIYRDTFNSSENFSITSTMDLLKVKAQEGEVPDMYQLAVMYYYGFSDEAGTGCYRDYAKAAELFQRIINEGGNDRYTDSSYYYLHKMYYAGTMPGEPQSYEKAYELVMLGRADRNAAAQYAYMKRNALGCEYNFEQNRLNQEMAAQFGDDIAIFGYAKHLYTLGRFAEAAEQFERMSYISPDAAYYLGIIYRDGVQVYKHSENPEECVPPSPDFFRACYYFQDAADRGHLGAAYELALLNFRPFEYHKRNFPKAQKYFEIAAEGGNTEAQYTLGYMYENGHVMRDVPLAIHYYELAAEKGHALSALQLSLLYQLPERKNYHRAYRYACQAAENGVAEAQYVLGCLLLFGRGCQANRDEALRYLREADRKYVFPATCMLREMSRFEGESASKQEKKH